MNFVSLPQHLLQLRPVGVTVAELALDSPGLQVRLGLLSGIGENVFELGIEFLGVHDLAPRELTHKSKGPRQFAIDQVNARAVLETLCEVTEIAEKKGCATSWDSP